MTEDQRIEVLDPIAESVKGKVQVQPECEVVANRIFALAVLDLYRDWQTEIWSRE